MKSRRKFRPWLALLALAGSGLACLRVPNIPCVVVQVDLNDDGVEEVASMSGFPLNVYARTDSGWARVGELRSEGFLDPRWLDSVRGSTPRVIRPRWHTLEVGGRRFYMAESAR